MRRLALVIAAIALLSAGLIAGSLFRQRQAPVPPPPTLAPVVPRIGPGEGVITFPEPVEGTPEANPQLIVVATVRDAITREPVVASRVILDGRVIAEDVSEFRFTLPGELLDYIFLEVQAPGYKEWQLGFRHQLKHSRIFPLTINLEPMPTRPLPGA